MTPFLDIPRARPAVAPTRFSWGLAVPVGLALCLAGCPGPQAEPATDEPSTGAAQGSERASSSGAEEAPHASPDDHSAIRQDVQAYIEETYADDDRARQAARQLARAFQRQAEVEDALAAQQVAGEVAEAVVCANRTELGDGDDRDRLQALTFNTEERAAAYERFQRLLSGRVLTLPSDPQCDHESAEAP